MKNCVPFLLFAGLPMAFAQLSMNQLVEQALANNRDLQALRQRTPEARGARLQASLRPNPTVDLNLSNGAIVRNSGYWDGGIGVSQVIELGRKRERRVEVAESDIRAVDLEIRERERLLRAAVQGACVDALAAARNLQTAQELLKLAEQGAAVVAARVAQGEAAVLDRSLLSVELGRVRADLILFANQRARALTTLRTLTGIAATEPLELAAGLETVQADMVLPGESLPGALANRPDLQLLRQLETGSDASIRLERSLAIPNVTASSKFTYTYDFIQRVNLSPGFSVPITDRCPIVTVGISMDLPWRNKNQGNIESAIARRQNVRLRREYQESVVTQEVLAAVERWEASHSAVQLFEKQVLEQARDNLRVVRAVYDQGELRLLDVINEQRKLNDAQRTFTDLLKERLLALVELERATGSEVMRGKL